MDINLSHNPVRERVEAYPAISEQLDAIFKGFKHLRDIGINLPNETLEWVANLEDIKRQFPK